jgi:hypothetical protein
MHQTSFLSKANPKDERERTILGPKLANDRKRGQQASFSSHIYLKLSFPPERNGIITLLRVLKFHHHLSGFNL